MIPGGVQNMSKKPSFPQELIGEEIEVVTATNSVDQGLKGKIVDETKSTITIQCTDDKERKLLKNTITFKIKKIGLIVDGKTILKRPEERIKG